MTNKLIGKTVIKVLLSGDRLSIKFVLSDGSEVMAYCDADCCSHTWIEDVIGVDQILGRVITAVEDIDLPEHLQDKTSTDNYEEEMKYYGCSVKSDGGSLLIAYRNSSNGYYGGRLHWPSDDSSFYGGVFGQNNPTNDDWREITE